MSPDLYKRPDKPLSRPVRKRTGHQAPPVPEIKEPLALDKTSECHVTPPDVAARMVDYLGPQGDYLTLEPSAGTGALIKALLDSGHSPCELVAVERHTKLAGALHTPGAAIINQCFLDYAATVIGKVEFPRIIMNPPFRQARMHMKAALSLLGPNGHACAPVLVALVPITYKHERAETLEVLPDATFSAARVNTKIIRIEGPL